MPSKNITPRFSKLKPEEMSRLYVGRDVTQKEIQRFFNEYFARTGIKEEILNMKIQRTVQTKQKSTSYLTNINTSKNTIFTYRSFIETDILTVFFSRSWMKYLLHQCLYHTFFSDYTQMFMPRIMCPNCGLTISLEERRNLDFNLIKDATRKKPTSFTKLLHITKLPRKT